MDNSQRRTTRRKVAKTVNLAGKSFLCEYKDCGKRFTRLEHLNRHALNHSATETSCPRCHASFKRADLLARHLDRHRKRDEESGGYGILNTRKRAWKQIDGTIADTRPSSEENGLAAETVSQASESVSLSPPINRNKGSPVLTSGAEGLASPPISQETSDRRQSLHSHRLDLSSHESSFDFQQKMSLSRPPIPLLSPPCFPFANTTLDNFWNSSLQVSGRGFRDSAHVPYDEVFQPDTASSFNMPYTTATNYNWLFDLNSDLALDNSPLEAANHHQQQRQQHFATQELGENGDIALGLEGRTFDYHDNFPLPAQSSCHNPPENNAIDSISPFFPQRNTISVSHRSAIQESSLEPDSVSKTFCSLPSSIQPLPSVELERPLSTLNRPESLPCIDECTRKEVLTLIESIQPTLPKDLSIARDDKLLSLSACQGYLDLFFTHFNTAYPLIHRPTFVASNVETLLLLSMLLLGATYSGKDAHQLAVCIHDAMRPAVFAHPAFSAQPELWVLETILLVECFGKSRAGQKQHDMSNLFHGLLINLIRRSDCQTISSFGPDEIIDSTDDLEAVWHRWVEIEQKKRLAFLCFLWDTQHAVLYCQSLCMSSFELRISLPSSQSLWEAQTASEWKSCGIHYTREPQFLTTLKSYLTPTLDRPSQLNYLSRVLILHGLMSIFWDMQRRDQTSLGVIPGESNATSNLNNVAIGEGSGNWRDRITRAYDLWKTDFDNYCRSVSILHQKQYSSGENPSAAEARQEFAVFATSYRAVYHAAQVLMHADFLDLQIYAGARHILGRLVKRNDYLRSERVVKGWATAVSSDPTTIPVSSSLSSPASSSLSAAKAVWHAATLLREASHHFDDFNTMPRLFHVPWCLYLATLTCWAFHHAAGQTRRSGGGNEPEYDGGEIVWDAKAEMDAFLDNMTSCGSPLGTILKQGCERTEGLVWVMASILERVRWGIVHAGVRVLRGLVPWRLINQYATM